MSEPINPDEDQAICSAQPKPCWRGPLQDNKLLAEKCRFGLASRVRSEQIDEPPLSSFKRSSIAKRG
jgi:hypothetical protein